MAAMKPAFAAVPVVPVSADALEQISGEVRSIKRILDLQVARPLPAHKGLEGSVESIRRLLSELIESRMEAVIGDLVFIRSELAAGGGAKMALERVDKLLQDLGAIRFEGVVLDYVDPLIHKVVEERRSPEQLDGVIVETVSPGFRTGRGTIVTRASVAVNRRS